MEPRILALTGMPASGKSTVAKQWEKMGAKRIHLGQYIWRWLKKKKIKPDTETESMAGLFLHKIYRDVPVLRWALYQIKKHPTKVYILDSLRSPEEFNYLKKRFKRIYLIAVVADPDIRFEREKNRARFGEEITRRKFELRDQEELELGIGKLISLADFYIDGNKSIDAVKHEAAKLFRKLSW